MKEDEINANWKTQHVGKNYENYTSVRVFREAIAHVYFYAIIFDVIR